MPSQIDPQFPELGEPTTESVRENFRVAQVEISDLQDLAAGALQRSGGTMSGDLLVISEPPTPLSAVPKRYVDSLFTGIASLIGVINAETGVVTYSIASGFPSGPLVEANAAGHGAYVICGTPGSVPDGPLAGEILATGDWIISDGEAWIVLGVAPRTILAQNVGVVPEVLDTDNVQDALEALDADKLGLAGGTMTGRLALDPAAQTGDNDAVVRGYVEANFVDRRIVNQLVETLVCYNGSSDTHVGLALGDAATGLRRTGNFIIMSVASTFAAQFGTTNIFFNRPLEMATNKISGLGEPTASNDAARLVEVNARVPLAGNALPMTGPLLLRSGDPTDAREAIPKAYADAPDTRLPYARRGATWEPAIFASSFTWSDQFTLLGTEPISPTLPQWDWMIPPEQLPDIPFYWMAAGTGIGAAFLTNHGLPTFTATAPVPTLTFAVEEPEGSGIWYDLAGYSPAAQFNLPDFLIRMTAAGRPNTMWHYDPARDAGIHVGLRVTANGNSGNTYTLVLGLEGQILPLGLNVSRI